MPEKRTFHPRTRRSGFRDARLVIIASEGTNTEKQYFDDLKSFYENPRVHVEALKRIDTASSPKRVLEQLDEFKTNYRLKSNYDELWLVIDVDRWGVDKLAEISRLVIQKHYFLAVSNPCFELWLLLHHRSLDEYNSEILIQFRENLKDGTNRTRLERELLAILGRYNKFNLATEDFLPNLQQAIERAQKSDTNPVERWPNDLGSRVYRLARRIIP
jgi:hypothetical protein